VATEIYWFVIVVTAVRTIIQISLDGGVIGCREMAELSATTS